MKRLRSLCLVALLAVSALSTSSCGSKSEAQVCRNSRVFEEREQEARAASDTQFSTPVIAACPELDPPSDGKVSSEGLTALEYGALLRGANGNFFDDGIWWLKALPRGESHVVPLQITAERCAGVTYSDFGYDYAFATPPLSDAPECGRYLTGVQAGHQLGDSWPRIFSIESTGAIGLAPLDSSSEFGPLLRLPRDLLSTPGRESRLVRLDVVRHDLDSVEFAALVEGQDFSCAARLVLKVGETTRLIVELELYPRARGPRDPRVTIAALEGWHSSEGAPDVDRVQAVFSDGSAVDTALSDADLDWGDGNWTRIPSARSNSALSSIAFLQGLARSEGAQRANVTVSLLSSSVPVSLELNLASEPVDGANVMANLLLDTAAAGANRTPVSVSYLVRAAPPSSGDISDR